MPSNPTPKRVSSTNAIGLALKKLRKMADLTQEEAAAEAGVVVQSWRRYEWGQRELSYDKLEDLAKAVRATREQLLAEARAIQGDDADLPGPADLIEFPRRPAPPTDLVLLPVRDPVRAGQWLSVDNLDQSPPRISTTARDPRYAHAEQWLAPVIGDSMNRRGILDGDLVHIVDAIAIHYIPVTGDVVEVARTRFQGREQELTLKEIEVLEDGVRLWPRSTNEQHRDPIVITDGLADEESDVRIRGLMLQLIRRF